MTTSMTAMPTIDYSNGVEFALTFDRITISQELAADADKAPIVTDITTITKSFIGKGYYMVGDMHVPMERIHDAWLLAMGSISLDDYIELGNYK